MSSMPHSIPSKDLSKGSAQPKEKAAAAQNSTNSNKTYVILRNLGEGSFGKVKEALHVATQEKIAVKVIEKDKVVTDDDDTRVRREIAIMRQVKHPNIVQLYEVIETEKYHFMVMEYVEGGELADYIETRDRLTETETARLFHQLVSAIAYLHSENISHRDIKPSNILMDHKNDLKLIDFGLGNNFTKGKGLKTSCGSPCFAAPEIINGVEYDAVKVDIWSLGVCFYCMLVGRLPFDEENKKELYRKIRTCSYKTPTYLSSVAISLLTSMLNLIPAARPSAVGILSHPFFQKANIVGISRGLKMGALDDLYVVAAYRSKIKPGTLKVMIENNEHNRQTTMLYLLIKKTERGDFDPAKERAKVESERKRDETTDREKKEDQYKKILGESQIDLQRASLRPKLKNSVTPASGGFPLNTIYRRKPSINGQKGSSLLIDTQRPQSRRILIDPALMKFKTEGGESISTPVENSGKIPGIFPHQRGLSVANNTTRSGSARAVKQERAQSLPETGSEAPFPSKNTIDNRQTGAPSSVEIKKPQLELDTRKPSTGSKNYYIRQGHPIPLRRLREGSNASQDKIDPHQISLLANVSSGGMPSLSNRGTNNTGSRAIAIGNSASPSPYAISSGGGYLAQNFNLSTDNPETFKVVAKHKAQQSSSKKKTKTLAKQSEDSGDIQLNQTMGLMNLKELQSNQEQGSSRYGRGGKGPQTGPSAQQLVLNKLIQNLAPRKINILIGESQREASVPGLRGEHVDQNRHNSTVM